MGSASATESVLASLQLPGSRRLRALQMLGWSLLLVLVTQLLTAPSPLPESADAWRIESVGVSRAGTTRDVGPLEPGVLPIDCLPEGPGWRCMRHLRVALPVPASSPAAPEHTDRAARSLYVPNFVGALVVTLDGQRIADSRSDQSDLSTRRSAPLLVPLPSPLPGAREQILELELVSRIAAGGRLEPFFVGDDLTLRRHREHTRLRVVALPRLFEGALLAMAMGSLTVWMLRRADTLYLLFGVMMLASIGRGLPSILLDAPGDVALLAANIGRFLVAALVLPFAWRLTGREPPLPTACFLLLPAAALAAVIVLPGPMSAGLIRDLFVPLSLVLCAIALWTVFRAAVAARSDAGLLFVAAIVLPILTAAMSMRDAGALLDMRAIMTGQSFGPLLAAVTGLLLIWHYSRTLKALEDFNLKLAGAVEDAIGRERSAAERERTQASRTALEAERVRLMSDLHDGLAGQLVSILSLSERTDDTSGRQIGEAARRALTDLRLVVASLEDMGGDLGLMMTAFRERLEPQLRTARIALDWRVGSLPELPGLHPEAVLGIYRILQEAVTNAVRHSGSPRLSVHAGGSPLPGHIARIVIADQGRGGVSDRPGGHGLGNMRRRARRLGASLLIERADGTTRIVLDLPERIAQPD